MTAEPSIHAHSAIHVQRTIHAHSAIHVQRTIYAPQGAIHSGRRGRRTLQKPRKYVRLSRIRYARYSTADRRGRWYAVDDALRRRAICLCNEVERPRRPVKFRAIPLSGACASTLTFPCQGRWQPKADERVVVNCLRHECGSGTSGSTPPTRCVNPLITASRPLCCASLQR